MGSHGFVGPAWLSLCVLVCVCAVVSLPCCSSLRISSFDGSYTRAFQHRRAEFGPHPYSITAPVILAFPKDLCSVYPGSLVPERSSTDMLTDCKRSNYTGQNPFARRILLAERGPQLDPCPFAVKVCNAQKLGAAGVIIGDYSDAEIIRSMAGIDGSSAVKIPSVFIRKSDYVEISKLALVAERARNTPMMATLIDDQAESDPWNDRQWEYSGSSSRIGVDVVTLAIFAFFFLACAMHIVWRIRKRCNRSNAVAAPAPMPANANGQPLAVAAPLSVLISESNESRNSIPLLPADSLAQRS